MDFSKLKLEQKITDILHSLGFLYPTEVQIKAIPTILSGVDAIVRSATGSGKTFAFVLPILQKIDVNNKNVQALVICPTRELAMQVADETKKIADALNVKVCAVFGGSNIDRQIASLKKLPQIVIGTTGRIMDLIKRRALKIENADYIVLDEADEMLDMGFRPDIENILSHTKQSRQTLLFSATIPAEVKRLASKYQNNATIVEIGAENKALDKIEQNYIYVDKKHKKQALLELFYSDIYNKTIVFVNTKAFAEDIEHFLNKNKIVAKALHGDIRQSERKRILDGFRAEKFYILIATDVAARGLDIKNVDYVINFDLPHEFEFYVHRIGRTARAGASGQVINIITSLEQLSQMRDIEKATKAKINLYRTESENLKQYFVDTKKLAKMNNRFANQSSNYDLNVNNKKFGIKQTKNKKNSKTSDLYNANYYSQNKFRRFSTFDYFEDYYETDYVPIKSKKVRKNKLKKFLNNNDKQHDNVKNNQQKVKFKKYSNKKNRA
ncbi:MAG TPA: DNA/RNA helicase [Clostridiales bacterium]|nr:DNA/RNA helicase [Clostridiales bacterium]